MIYAEMSSFFSELPITSCSLCVLSTLLLVVVSTFEQFCAQKLLSCWKPSVALKCALGYALTELRGCVITVHAACALVNVKATYLQPSAMLEI